MTNLFAKNLLCIVFSSYSRDRAAKPLLPHYTTLHTLHTLYTLNTLHYLELKYYYKLNFII